ncbi:MAG TPA: metal-dependent hydrolase, partial [Methanomassiliicoccales archaeon]|nr:metal-dependent hydrolase [Methanomassiliicoccales archaeon]HQM67593.1 metal-dependent hydrolase [Methanomassiliicoccales archaeon]
LVTHAHHDHLGDALDLSKRFGCPVLSVVEVSDRLEELGAKVVPGNIGGEIAFPFCRVKVYPAVHTSSFDDGRYGGAPCSFLVRMGGKAVYHAGDTALFGDLALVGEEAEIDAALLPVGGVYTMGIRDAVKAMRLLGAKRMVPMHYDTWDVISVAPDEMRRASAGEGFELCILAPGERLRL